jgi:hypothetical protein
MSFGVYTITLLLMALAGVLITGIALMGMGGKANFKYGNTLMRARIWLQGLVLLVLLLMFLSAKS